ARAPEISSGASRGLGSSNFSLVFTRLVLSRFCIHSLRNAFALKTDCPESTAAATFRPVFRSNSRSASGVSAGGILSTAFRQYVQIIFPLYETHRFGFSPLCHLPI